MLRDLAQDARHLVQLVARDAAMREEVTKVALGGRQREKERSAVARKLRVLSAVCDPCVVQLECVQNLQHVLSVQLFAVARPAHVLLAQPFLPVRHQLQRNQLACLDVDAKDHQAGLGAVDLGAGDLRGLNLSAPASDAR